MRNNKKIYILLGCFMLFICTGYLFWISSLNPIPRAIDHTFISRSASFPEIDPMDLSERQKNILKIAKQEFEQQPDSTKYSQGVKEAWCADFVSWVYKEAGYPFENPHSGSWRIPGTLTLRDYYEAQSKFKISEEYSPKPGDVVFYDNPSPFGQHVNIIVSVNDDGSLTTVGGNEPGGIRVLTHTRHKAPGFRGYGELR